ncbi:MAG: 2-phosphosulfolactate phosphatase [Bacillota bacterium]|jgi:2-phosphosulfolactate phosphatase
MRVDACLTLEGLPAAPLTDVNVVVIDVLRASTTILAALECHIPWLIPVATLEEAQSLHQSLRGQCYLGGERHRVRPQGFDFGNSPLEYRRIEQPLPVVYTTSNGTRALKQVQAGRRVLVGSLRNAAALAAVLCQEAQPVLLVCSGTRGQVAAEDVFCAGALIKEMQSRVAIEVTDAAQIALFSYLQVACDLPSALLRTASGQGLTKLGMGADVRYAAEHNVSRLVPHYLEGKLVPWQP